jgi:hypothetical protein
MHCWCGFPGIAAASQVCIAGAKGQADGNNGHSSMRACNHQHIALRLNGVMLKTAKQVMRATSLWELTWSFCCSAWRCLLAFRAWSSACTSAIWYFTCASACGCSCHQSCMHACVLWAACKMGTFLTVLYAPDLFCLEQCWDVLMPCLLIGSLCFGSKY